MEYSIQEVARAAGTTSRTLRHYGSVGLVQPSRIGAGGYRYYDDRALVRLQRVLLLRELGLGLDAIGEVLRAQDAESRRGESPPSAEARILRSHLELLRRERERVDAQIGAVERTVAALEGAGEGTVVVEGASADPRPSADSVGRNRTQTRNSGDREKGSTLMEQNIFEGFDHAQYREEVEERWGKDAYARSDRWWRGLGPEGQREWQERVARLSADWTAASERGADPASPEAQELAARHADWLRSIPGTPRDGFAGYLMGLGEMYVADERFAANYGGVRGAGFVRDALREYVRVQSAGRQRES